MLRFPDNTGQKLDEGGRDSDFLEATTRAGGLIQIISSNPDVGFTVGWISEILAHHFDGIMRLVCGIANDAV